MRVLARPGLLLRRRIDALDRQLTAASIGEVEGIHQARVASRRVREVLPLVAGMAGEHDSRGLRRDLRTITRRLGPVRELDVALATLADLQAGDPEHAVAIAAVRGQAAIERERAWPEVARALSRLQIAQLARRVRSLAAIFDSPVHGASSASRSAARLDARIARLNEAVTVVGVVFAPGPMHEVRIALKKFRYALEIAAELGRFRLDGSLARLKSLQNLLGDLHDLQVLAGRVRDCEAATRAAAARRRLRALAAELDERVRQLHSRYLDQRVALVTVVGRARRTAVTLGLMGQSLPE